MCLRAANIRDESVRSGIFRHRTDMLGHIVNRSTHDHHVCFSDPAFQRRRGLGHRASATRLLQSGSGPSLHQ